MAARKKVGELQDYKERRRRERELNNLEQRMLLDQIAEGQNQKRQHAAVPWTVGNRDRLPLSKDKDVRHLQIEYERAREKGGKRPNPVVFAPQHRYRKPYLPETTTPRYNPHTDPKVQLLAETHGRQMEYLQNKNRELERQRDEIRRRLEDLGRRPPEKDNSTDELLRELREQEARNQRLLNELRLQLAEARRPINVVQQHAPEPGKKSFIYPIYYGNSLVAEIIAVRQAYLQNGGNDPEILAQLAQMLAEAQAIDESMKHVQKRQPKDRKDGSAQLLALEFENERLQRQLMLLQDQKIVSGNRRKDHREGRILLTPDSASRPASPNKQPDTEPFSPRRPHMHRSPPHVLPDRPPSNEPDTAHEPHTKDESETDPRHAANTKDQSPRKETDPRHAANMKDESPHKETDPRHATNTKDKSPRKETDPRHAATTKQESPRHEQPVAQESFPYKPVPVHKTLSKWVQTNPVPSLEADKSALAYVDYPTKRQNARLALEGRWGPGNVLPNPSGGPQPLKRASQVEAMGRIRRVGRGGFPDPPVTLKSLQPERLDTIKEAANVDDYNPEEPLDVDLSSLKRKKNKHFFPYRADIGPRLNSARLIIVNSERPYGWVDFYGRPVDEKGTLLDTQGPEERLRQTVLPYFRKSLTDPRLLAYRRYLNSVYGRPRDPLYDPYYSSLYQKRRLYTAEPLDIDTKSILGPRESTYPLIQQDQEHKHGDQHVPRTANAAAQTQPLQVKRKQGHVQAPQPLRRRPMVTAERDPELNLNLENVEPSPRMGRKRQPPPTQRPPILDTPQTAQPENPPAAVPQSAKEDQKGKKTKKKGT